MENKSADRVAGVVATSTRVARPLDEAFEKKPVIPKPTPLARHSQTSPSSRQLGNPTPILQSVLASAGT